MIAAGHVLDRHHVHELQQLRVDLRDNRVRADGDQRDARHRRIVGGRDREGLDVVAAGGDQAGDAGERAGFVLQKYRDEMPHGVKGYGRAALGRQGENC